MLVKSIKVAGLALMLVSGCGGGASTPATVTVTQPPGSSAPSETTTTIDPAQQVSAYLTAMQPIRDDLNGAAEALKPFVTDAKLSDQGQWPQAGQKLKDTADTFERYSIKLSEMHGVPESLQHAHAEYIKSVQGEQQAFDNLGTALLSGNLSTAQAAVTRFLSQIDHVQGLVSDWKLAVTVQADKFHVDLPPNWDKVARG